MYIYTDMDPDPMVLVEFSRLPITSEVQMAFVLQVAYARLKARKRGEEHLIHLDYLKVTLFPSQSSRSGSS
jgi:hypothetical protein